MVLERGNLTNDTPGKPRPNGTSSNTHLTFGHYDYVRGPAVKVRDNVPELWHVTQCGSRNEILHRSSPLDTILTHIVQPTPSRLAKELPITDITATAISTAK